mmetsp:Transcript_11103/g.24482  ORF Transcript_11103/g.24482 Transcript_11103/m.24482 type:complete len:260 (+) Transcript_11103:772-1551(+)
MPRPSDLLPSSRQQSSPPPMEEVGEAVEEEEVPFCCRKKELGFRAGASGGISSSASSGAVAPGFAASAEAFGSTLPKRQRLSLRRLSTAPPSGGPQTESRRSRDSSRPFGSMTLMRPREAPETTSSMVMMAGGPTGADESASVKPSFTALEGAGASAAEVSAAGVESWPSIVAMVAEVGTDVGSASLSGAAAVSAFSSSDSDGRGVPGFSTSSESESFAVPPKGAAEEPASPPAASSSDTSSLQLFLVRFEAAPTADPK